MAGIDDAKLPKAHRGNVVFSVVGDGKELAKSPQLTVDDEAFPFKVDVTDVNYVDLDVAKVVAAGTTGHEWADGANAKFSCGDEVPALTLEPVVEGGNAVAQDSAHQVTVADLKAGSEASLTFGEGAAIRAMANDKRVATFTLAIPADAAVGAATLTVTGTDRNGQSATGTANLAVTVPEGTVTGNAILAPSGLGANGLAAMGTSAVVVTVADEVEPPEAATLDVPATALKAGDMVTITVPGLEAGSSLRAELHSAPVGLGTATANDAGVATLETTIPGGTAAGEHRIVVFGMDTNSLAATGSLAVVVRPNGTTGPGEDAGETPGETPDKTPCATPPTTTPTTPTPSTTAPGTTAPGTTAPSNTAGAGTGSENGSGNGSGNDTTTGGGGLSHIGANGVLPILGIAFLALLGGASTILVRRRNHG